MDKTLFWKNDQQKFKIFQIGFNKCGTRSLHHFFHKNKVKSQHYDAGKIASTMLRHYSNGEPLVDIRYRDIVFFGDIENIYDHNEPIYIPQLLFKELYKQYPKSKFILNIRDKNKWLKSRCLHGNGEYLTLISEKLGKTEEEVVEIWDLEWDKHINNVKDFFKDKPDKLIIYNIEKDSIHKIINFFKNDLKLDSKLYKHLGKTKI